MTAISERLPGKVAFITGAASGIGRATAVRFAEEGAVVVAVDLERAAPALEELSNEVSSPGLITTLTADVRSQSSLDAAVAETVARFGRIDAVLANAGVWIPGVGGPDTATDEEWDTQIDVNLSGVWRTIRAVSPQFRAGGHGGTITITSSVGGLRTGKSGGPYATAKFGLQGLAQSAAHTLGEFRVRVNTVNPTVVETALVFNEALLRRARPDLDAPTVDDVRQNYGGPLLLDIPWIQPVDVANAVLFLASDEARYITGIALPVDAGHGISWQATGAPAAPLRS